MNLVEVGDDGGDLLRRVQRQGGGETEIFLELADEDDDRDAARETGDHRIRDEFDEVAEAEQAHDQEHETGEQRGEGEAFVAMQRDDAAEDRHEGASRSADLHLAAAECGNEKAADDRRPQSLRGRDPRGDAESDGQRKCDDADGDAGGEIAQKCGAIIAAQAVEKLRAHRD